MTTVTPTSGTDQARGQGLAGSDTPVLVTGGVDTHAETHTAAALDGAGRSLGHRTFPATAAGYAALLGWLRGLGLVVAVGVEGTGAYGAGLAAHLAGAGVEVVEVNRPDRAARRAVGKSDPTDAVAAARAVQAGVRTATPKDRIGDRGARLEALRVLRVARRGAVGARALALTQLRTVLVTAPAALREQLDGLSTRALLSACAGLRPDTGAAAAGDPLQATKVTLRALARRHATAAGEVDDLDDLIEPLVEALAPRLLAAKGVGPNVAGQLLVTAGANTDRLTSEGAFAMLCGVAPLPASSGKTRRHRLNRGGDRQANAALYTVVLCRMRHDERTKAYVARRTTEGLSKKDIIRCLKRTVARELYYLLQHPHAPADDHALAT